jgi:S-DNA-T family DNA segregation ATPase FtsK/SpoIIIE
MRFLKKLFLGEKEVAVPDDISDIGDPLYPEAVKLAIGKGITSISELQRALRVGYRRATELVRAMELDGILTPLGGENRVTLH